MTDELKPLRECPFCGGEARFFRATGGMRGQTIGFEDRHEISCSNCQYILFESHSRKRLFDRWNTRAIDPRLEKCFALLRGIEDKCAPARKLLKELEVVEKYRWNCSRCNFYWEMSEPWKESYPWVCQQCHEKERP